MAENLSTHGASSPVPIPVASTTSSAAATGPDMPSEENLLLRDQYIAESCELHFNRNPIKLVRSEDQYLFDDMGKRYLDFVTRITNVGHCHPKIVTAACKQMSQMTLTVEDEDTTQQEKLTEQLLATLPSNFEVVLYTNSGAEANDLALQLVRNCTNRHDLVVVDGAFHGTGNLLVDISTRAFKLSEEGKKPWVHVIPIPDTYRGPYGTDCDAGEKYLQDAKTVIDRVASNGHNIAGLICEPVMVVQGVVIPPPKWLSGLYSHIHELGGLVVADEIQCGMGRTGETFWAFEGQNAIPDIITVGKPFGNGYPIAAVITSQRIACSIKENDLIYKCDPVGARVCMTVLNLMQEHQLMNNALNMGTFLADGLRKIKKNHIIIGDVRNKGLIVGVDIVRSEGSKKPAPDIAEEICNRLRKELMLVGCEGDYKNVLLFLPALCISKEDCINVINTLDRVTKYVELSFMDDLYDILNSPSSNSSEPSTSSGPSAHPSSYDSAQDSTTSELLSYENLD